MENKEEIKVLVESLFDFGSYIGQYIRDKFNINGKNNCELSMRQFRILMALYKLNVDSISQLEDTFKISKSSLSLTISKMEKSGLIYKEHNPEDSDKRTVHIKLTPKGIELIEKFNDTIYNVFLDFYNSLDSSRQNDLKTGIKYLKNVVE